jgi:hypothetical protein
MKKNFGLVTASALAAILSNATIASAAPDVVDGHYCANNSCKGKSDCGGMGNTNGCAGKNTCKGHGFKSAATSEDCTKAGGKWSKAPAEGEKKEEAPKAAPAKKKK